VGSLELSQMSIDELNDAEQAFPSKPRPEEEYRELSGLHP
jgi:hypothetical protein